MRPSVNGIQRHLADADVRVDVEGRRYTRRVVDVVTAVLHESAGVGTTDRPVDVDACRRAPGYPELQFADPAMDAALCGSSRRAPDLEIESSGPRSEVKAFEAGCQDNCTMLTCAGPSAGLLLSERYGPR